jgi:hypothetical protein
VGAMEIIAFGKEVLVDTVRVLSVRDEVISGAELVQADSINTPATTKDFFSISIKLITFFL